MNNIENGHFHHTVMPALSCVSMMAVAGVLVSICSLDSLVKHILSYDVAVIQWITSCQKLYDHKFNNT